MSKKEHNEDKKHRGSNVYLTGAEKEALIRAIDQYESDVDYATESAFTDFFYKCDEKALQSARIKLLRRK